MSRNRAFTLTEILVAATLLLLALGLAFGYLIPAARAAGRLRIRSHLQQTAVVALRDITSGATTTSPRGFSWASGPGTVALAFNPVDGIQTADAALRWSEVYDITWWRQSDHTLRKRRWPPGPPNPTDLERTVIKAKRLSPERLAEIVSVDAEERILARGVKDFKVSHPGLEGVFIQPVTVELTLVEEGLEEETQGVDSVTQKVVFRVENQQ